MKKVLIVDDEESYREHLAIYLSSHGYQTETAGSGKEAVEKGIHFRPQAVVVDWMLQGNIHGLHVASVLRAVDPTLQALLISGFASPDLRYQANYMVFAFLEKPFEPERLQELLQQAVAAAPTSAETDPMIPVFETDKTGTISFANPAARELLSELGGRAQVRSLEDLLSKEGCSRIDELERNWVEVASRGGQMSTSWIKARRLSHGGLLFVLLRAEQELYFRTHPIVEMLLDTSDKTASWPFSGRALVVDDEEIVRRLVMTVFERVGCLCHSAENHDLAVRLFERDPGISFVILDYDMPGDPAWLVRELRRVRPGTTIVGTSGRDHRADFRAAEVDLFLAKPWRIEDLIGLLKTNAPS